MDLQSAMNPLIDESPSTFSDIYFKANIYLISISVIVLIVMKIMTSIYNPWNYVLVSIKVELR